MSINSHGLFYDIMDNYITRPLAPSKSIHASRNYGHSSNKKLESQKIIEFLGRIEDWKKWKLITECDFSGPGYDVFLSDALFA